MAVATKIELAPRRSWLACRWFAFAFAFAFDFDFGLALLGEGSIKKAEKKSKFGDQSLPTLHNDQSYTILLPDSTNAGADKPVAVTPMTVVYDYELHDGELLYKKDLIPNLGFDYAVLGIGGFRNLNRDTGESVSLDEVYLHHLLLEPGFEVGSEAQNHTMEHNPLLLYPDGYAMHILTDQHPHFNVVAHVLSNKNLAPINGSLELARKECNECYYAPGKGSSCTPKASGRAGCCGHSAVCMKGVAGECSCATTTTKSTTTKYRIEIDFLVSRDVESFEDIDKWLFSAPSCLDPNDNFCPDDHDVPQQPNEQPYFKSTSSFQSPASGILLFAQGHLHTGGVNITLYRNGEIICTNTAEHGTNPDPSTNAKNEQNHIVKMSSCYNQIPATGIRVEIGDVLTTESYYHGGTGDTRLSSELVAGEHKNAMSLFFTSFFIEQVKLAGHVIDRKQFPKNFYKQKNRMRNDFSLPFKDIDIDGIRGTNNNN